MAEGGTAGLCKLCYLFGLFGLLPGYLMDVEVCACEAQLVGMMGEELDRVGKE